MKKGDIFRSKSSGNYFYIDKIINEKVLLLGNNSFTCFKKELKRDFYKICPFCRAYRALHAFNGFCSETCEILNNIKSN